MNLQNVADIYALSPLQQVMFLHERYDPASRANFVQTSYVFQGDFQPAAFRKAWERVIERHAALRTLFIAPQDEEPLQVVRQRVPLPWRELDWQDLSAPQQEMQLQELLHTDYVRGFTLSQAPLLRMLLIRLGPQAYHFTWSVHHIILDGWSSSLVFNEVFTCYNAFRHERDLHLPLSRPYSHYIAWLQQQNLASAAACWRRMLRGFKVPTLLSQQQTRMVYPPLNTSEEGASPNGAGSPLSPDPQEQYAEQQCALSATTTAALQAKASHYQVTLNTLLQGVWALLLARQCGSLDVVFGATVAGRPANLAQVDTMVGMFINILPVRVRLVAESRLDHWLRQLQSQLLEIREYEYCSLMQIREWSELPWNLPLFESLLVFENYPPAHAVEGSEQEVAIQLHRAGVRTNYPLTLVIEPVQELRLLLVYDTRFFSEERVIGIMTHFRELLDEIIAQPSTALSSYLPSIPQSDDEQPDDRDTVLIPAVDHGNTLVEPRNMLELQLVRIWEEILEVHPIGVTDDFFALGGESLLAIRLMTQIRKRLGQHFPLDLLFEGRSIARIAASLQERGQNLPQSSLVTIQPYGGKVPFFCIHPALGYAFCYYQLARYLSPDQPLYALQDLAIYNEEDVYISLPELATRYIQEIRAIQPQGPYLLGGFSFGGLVAFEMAQQLRAQRQEVALLAILDTGTPATASKFVDDAVYLAIISLELLRGSLQQSLQELYESLLPLEPEARLFYIIDCIEKATGRPAEVSPAWLRLELQIFKHRVLAVERYPMQPYSGPITLFRASQRDAFEHAQASGELLADLGWGKFAMQPLEIYTIPGYHDTLLEEPAIRMLADHLQRCLDTCLLMTTTLQSASESE